MSNSKPQLHPASDVITKLYSAIADNKNIPGLLAAWDGFVDGVFQIDPEEARLWQTLLSEHFEEAGKLVVINNPSMAEKKQAFVDRQTFPAILFNSGFRLVAKNQQAERIWPQEFDCDISNAILPPFDAQRILSFDSRDQQYCDPVLVSLNISGTDYSQAVMAVIHPVGFSSGDGTTTERMYVMRIATPKWYPELSRMLSKTYGLTDAELEVVKGLYQNRSLNTIAKERSRSKQTVRKQLSHIFEKTNASSQPELIGMISSLCQILEVGKNGIEPDSIQTVVSSAHCDIKPMTCHSREGHTLSFATYGDPKGRPVLSIQPTMPPEMSTRFRQAAVDHGLKIIAPYKPGSGQSSSRNYQYSPKIAASDYQLILESLGIEQAGILGICSGGIYALEFANRYPESVERIVLSDTGVPLRGRKDFLRMSTAPRRTFIAARYFPRMLLTPHRLIAKEFHQSQEGERRIIEYFFNGSVSDMELVLKNEEFYRITRDIIRYSFEDIRHLVDCVCLWASDWRDLLLSVSEHHSVRFVHGEFNNVFAWNAVEEFIKENCKLTATPIEGCSQLGIFVNPEVLMQEF